MNQRKSARIFLVRQSSPWRWIMLRTSLIACALAVPLGLVAAAPAARAGTHIALHFGVPFYAYQVAPHYRYYRGYGWYDAYRYPRFRGTYYDYGDDEAYGGRPWQLSCREARRLVREHGFHGVETRSCEGRNYTFSGFRNGTFAIIHVNSRTGRVWLA
jgi:hypothetical protein